MKRVLAYSVFAALALTAFCSALSPLFAFQIPQPGTIITLAGNGQGGYSGDGGPSTQAQIRGAHWVALDAAGNVYITQPTFSVVRKVGLDGSISTVAGTGKAGFSGDNGPAAQAKLNMAHAITVDGAGNLYITDSGNNRVRKVSPDGIITTIVGTGKGGFSGDGGPATAAQINSPTAVAVDREDNLYITEFFGHRIRKVSPSGIITTVAGTGKPGYSGDGGPAVQAQLYSPDGIVVDADGNLLFTDLLNHRVRKVSRDGMISLVAGSDPVAHGFGMGAFSGDGGPAIQAQLNTPHGVTVDTAGNIFIADVFNHRIRKVTPDGIITTVVGSGPVGNTPEANGLPYSGEGGPATAARLAGPHVVAVDGAGNLLIVEDNTLASGPPGNWRVLKVVGVAAPGLIAGQPYPDNP